jgi:hypothetical protein
VNAPRPAPAGIRIPSTPSVISPTAVANFVPGQTPRRRFADHRGTSQGIHAMNRLAIALLSSLLLATPLAASAAPPAQATAAPSIMGTVLETKDAAGYTYLRLKTPKDGELWAAVPAAQVKVGATVTIEDPQTMANFQSKTLNKTFDRIIFGTLGGGASAQAAPDLKAMHAGANQPAPEVKDVKVEKAKGKDAQTVAGIVTGADKLKDKPVEVRGQVVKFSGDIMGKNWVHLRDGSGSAKDSTNDVLVVTSDTAKVGDIVLAKGTVRTDRNLGMGYSYKVLVEDAKLTK